MWRYICRRALSSQILWFFELVIVVQWSRHWWTDLTVVDRRRMARTQPRSWHSVARDIHYARSSRRDRDDRLLSSCLLFCLRSCCVLFRLLESLVLYVLSALGTTYLCGIWNENVRGRPNFIFFFIFGAEKRVFYFSAEKDAHIFGVFYFSVEIWP